MTLEELTVKINADMSDLKKDLKATQAQVQQFATQVEQSNNRVARSYESLASKIPWAAIISALTKITKAAIQTSASMEEVQNAVDVAFGNSADSINDWAKSVRTNFGLGEQSAKSMASTFKILGDSVDLSNDAAEEMAKNLTQLTGDLASFRDKDIEDVANALEGIYTGQTRALTELVGAVTETTLQEYALKNGVKESLSEMSQQEKAILRYYYVMEKSRQAMGDYKRTEESVTNQTRDLKESGTELLQQFGKALEPATKDVLKLLKDMIPSVSTLIQGIADVVEATNPIIDVVHEVVGADLKTLLAVVSSYLKTMAPVLKVEAKLLVPLLELVNMLANPLVGARQLVATIGYISKVLKGEMSLEDALKGLTKDFIQTNLSGTASIAKELAETMGLIEESAEEQKDAEKDATDAYKTNARLAEWIAKYSKQTTQSIQTARSLLQGFDELNLFQRDDIMENLNGPLMVGQELSKMQIEYLLGANGAQWGGKDQANEKVDDIGKDVAAIAELLGAHGGFMNRDFTTNKVIWS